MTPAGERLGVPSEHWLDVAGELASGELELITAWDDAPRAQSVSVVLLVRFADGLREVLTQVGYGGRLESLTGLWPGAAWWERSVVESFGLDIPGAHEPLLGGVSLLRSSTLERRAQQWPGSYDPAGKRAPRPMGAP